MKNLLKNCQKHDKSHFLAGTSKVLLHRFYQAPMSVIYLLLALSILVALIFFVAFIVSVKSGQFDDSYTPSVRMLFDDEIVKEEKNDSSTKTI